jgi:hypothetical protein
LTDTKHADALATIERLHALGATHVRVNDGEVEVRFDRVFVPLKPPDSIPVRLDGDEVVMSADDVQLMRDELESLREMRRRVEAAGLI